MTGYHEPDIGEALDETLRKLTLYFRRGHRHWRPADSVGELGYPIDFSVRLSEGHFDYRDANGIPLRKTSHGPVHNYTRICGWALAHCALIEDGRDCPESRGATIRAAEYIVRTGDWYGEDLRLRSEVPGHGHVGPLSAMSQGQAMSVLVRAHRLTDNGRYLEAAQACLGPFRRDLHHDGVTVRMPGNGGVWFEEDTSGLPGHILNGMIFALWGLADLASLGMAEAAHMQELGTSTLVRLLHRYDLGWWSAYDRPETARPYVASMGYHELHIAQLLALYKQTGSATVLQVARRFDEYRASFRARAKAGLTMFVAKATGDYQRRHYARS